MEDLLGLEGLTKSEKALRIRKYKKKSSIALGKAFLEEKEETKDREKFKNWVDMTSYCMSAVNRNIAKMKLHNLCKTEKGKETVEELSLNLVSKVFKLEKYSKEKFQELIKYIELEYGKEDIEQYLFINHTEEPKTMKNRDFRNYLKEMLQLVQAINIIAITGSAEKKISRQMQNLIKSLSECTQLNVMKTKNEVRKKIEKINYNLSVLSIN